MIIVKQDVWDSPEFYLACKRFVEGHGSEADDFGYMLRILFRDYNMYNLYGNFQVHFVIEDRDI